MQQSSQADHQTGFQESEGFEGAKGAVSKTAPSRQIDRLANVPFSSFTTSTCTQDNASSQILK